MSWDCLSLTALMAECERLEAKLASPEGMTDGEVLLIGTNLRDTALQLGEYACERVLNLSRTADRILEERRKKLFREGKLPSTPAPNWESDL